MCMKVRERASVYVCVHCVSNLLNIHVHNLPLSTLCIIIILELCT